MKMNKAVGQFSRRSFLGTGAVASAACMSGVAGGTATAASTAPNPAKMRVSVLSYAFHGLLKEGRMDTFGYLETCKYRYGLDAADIWNAFLTSTEESYIRKIRQALDEREMVLADLCTDNTYVWHDKPEVREKNYQNALAHLKAAEILGARFMRLDSGATAATWTDEQFDHIVKRYKEYAQFAHDHGFKVGAENHWGPEKSWANLKKLYQAVDHPGFGLSIHIYDSWAGTPEEKDAADREVAPWVSHTHLDFKLSTGPRLEEKLATLWNAGYSGYYSVEHHSGKDEYLEVAMQLANVRRILEQFRTGQSKLVTPSGRG
jgi:sugar phosphate isomerase/epimerase